MRSRGRIGERERENGAGSVERVGIGILVFFLGILESDEVRFFCCCCCCKRLVAFRVVEDLLY